MLGSVYCDTLCSFEPQIWPVIITSCDANQKCLFQRLRKSCDVIICGAFLGIFAKKGHITRRMRPAERNLLAEEIPAPSEPRADDHPPEGAEKCLFLQKMRFSGGHIAGNHRRVSGLKNLSQDCNKRRPKPQPTDPPPPKLEDAFFGFGGCTGRRAKTGRFGSLAFAMKNRHFGESAPGY